MLSCKASRRFDSRQGSTLGSFFFAIFGWLSAALGHDAGHFAVSRTPWVNDACVWGMSLVANPMMWQHEHTYAHHTHTNEFARDPDLHHWDFVLRVHRNFQRKDLFKWQSNVVFVICVYSFAMLGTCVFMPWVMIQTGSLYGLAEWTDRKRPLRALGMWAHLALYLGIIVVCPFFAKSSVFKATASVLLHVFTSGFLFSVFTQVNHLNEASLEVDPANRKSLAVHSWAASQVVTSNNFAANNHMWDILSIGLNFQIEHHLFPGLNHCHLRLIAPVVQQTCKEYGVMYKSYGTFSEILAANLKWLDTMSDEPDRPEEEGLSVRSRDVFEIFSLNTHRDRLRLVLFGCEKRRKVA